MKPVLNTASRYANRVGILLIGLFLTPYLLSVLGPEMLGLQILATQALQFCLMLGTACGRGYTRYATLHYARGNYHEMNLALSRGATMTLILNVLAFAIIALLAIFAGTLFGLDGDLLTAGRWVFVIIGIGLLFDQSFELWNALLSMTQRFYISAFAQLTARLLAFVGVIVLFYFTTPSIIKWAALTVVLTIAIKYFYVLPIASRLVPEAAIRLANPAGAEFAEMLRFSTASLIAGLGFLLYYSSNSIIISNMDHLGPAKIASYNFGQRWDPVIRDVVLALASSLTPVFTAQFARNSIGRLRRTYLLTTRYALLLGLFPCILLFAYSYPFISLWVGEVYAYEASPVLKLSMINAALSIPAIVAYEALLGMGKIGKAAKYTLVGGALNVLLAIVLAGPLQMGLVGIAISTLITWGVVTCMIFMYILCNSIDLKLRDVFNQAVLRPLLIGLLTLIFASGLCYIYSISSWLDLAVAFAICGAFYGALSVTAGLPNSERVLLYRKIKLVSDRWFH